MPFIDILCGVNPPKTQRYLNQSGPTKNVECSPLAYIERAVTPRHKEEAKVGVHGGNPPNLPGPIDAETKDEAEAEAEAEAPGQTPVVTAGSPVSIEALEGEQTGEEV